jgi:hypothetical protein
VDDYFFIASRQFDWLVSPIYIILINPFLISGVSEFWNYFLCGTSVFSYIIEGSITWENFSDSSGIDLAKDLFRLNGSLFEGNDSNERKREQHKNNENGSSDSPCVVYAEKKRFIIISNNLIKYLIIVINIVLKQTAIESEKIFGQVNATAVAEIFPGNRTLDYVREDGSTA